MNVFQYVESLKEIGLHVWKREITQPCLRLWTQDCIREIVLWSFTLEDGIGRVDVGCCWLLLIADGCYWLLLVVAEYLLRGYWLWVIAGCGWDTACWIIASCCCWLLDDCWSRLGYYLLIDCWRRNLWIYSGYRLFAAKTILQAQKSFNISRTLMICG